MTFGLLRRVEKLEGKLNSPTTHVFYVDHDALKADPEGARRKALANYEQQHGVQVDDDDLEIVIVTWRESQPPPTVIPHGYERPLFSTNELADAGLLTQETDEDD